MTYPLPSSVLTVLVITQGYWGERIANHVGRFHPPHWAVHRWAAPPALPLVMDDPADYVPPSLPAADLVLALGETPAVAQLIPDIVKQASARSVIAPIDRNESLPPGLAAQLKSWLADLGVAVVCPKPFCSLTETTYNRPPIVMTYDDPAIREFARHFGLPDLRLTVDNRKHVGSVAVIRDSACGCARFVANGLPNCPVEQAEYEAGMLHHHYPCLASMNQDADYHETLMHVSGHILRAAVKEQLIYQVDPSPYLRPMGRVDAEGQ